MEFDGLKINGGNSTEPDKVANEASSKPKLEEQRADFGFGAYQVEGEEYGKSILDGMRKKGGVLGDEVIYGVYNNSEKALSVRLNDFLIDHSSIKLKDKSYFFHMLAVMVDAGIPVVYAVESLAKRSKNLRFRRVLGTVAYFAKKGSNLSDAMSRFDDVFDEVEIGIVQSGEATGRLNKMLFKLSSQLDRRHDLYLKLWAAAAYPIAVLAVLFLVTVGMLLWVFPTLLSLLTEGGLSTDDLPLATRALLMIQNAILNGWYLIIGFLAVCYLLFKFYVSSGYGAMKWDFFKLKIPLIGGLLRKVYVLRFVSLLGILMDSGLPVIKALTITGNSIDNGIYKVQIKMLIDRVREGEKISLSLRENEFLFPAEITEMLAVGEASASVAPVAEKIGEQYQREIDNSLKQLTSVFEPVMILFVGITVALLALAIMAPIFNLTTSVS